MNEEQPDYIKRIKDLSLSELDEEFTKKTGLNNSLKEPVEKKRSEDLLSKMESVVDESIEAYVTYAVLNNDISTAVLNLKKLISQHLEIDVIEAIKNKIESLIDWPRLKVKDKLIMTIDGVDPELRSDILSRLRDECILEGIYGKESRDALKAKKLIDPLVKYFSTPKYHDSAENINNILLEFRENLSKSPSIKKLIKEKIEKLISDIDIKIKDETLADLEKINFENRKYLLREQLDSLE